MDEAPADHGHDGPEVTLRGVALEDAETLSRLELQNREYLLIGAPRRTDRELSVEGQRARIANDRAQLEAGRTVPLVILADGEVVGRLTLSDIVRGALQGASLGYWVSEHASGRGIATAAVRRILEVAFGPLRLHRVQAEVAVGNDASARVLTRCGFAEFGLAPAYLQLGGSWRACRMFQRIDERWDEERADSRDGGQAAAAPAPEPSAAIGFPDSARSASSGSPLRVSVETPPLAEALALYDAVGWCAYTREPEVLHRALDGSAVVVTARDEGRLVGLARAISDGASIAYLQDVLVDPAFRRKGAGRALVEAALAPFATARQQVLLTDAEPGPRAFYEALGFTETRDHAPELRAFVRRGKGA